MFLCDSGYRFVLQIDKLDLCEQSLLGASLHAFAACVAFLCVDDYVVFA
jgi:hypothetical protein